MRGRLGDVLRQLGETLASDRRLACTINRFVRRAAVGVAADYGDGIVRLVSETVHSWDARDDHPPAGECGRQGPAIYPRQRHAGRRAGRAGDPRGRRAALSRDAAVRLVAASIGLPRRRQIRPRVGDERHGRFRADQRRGGTLRFTRRPVAGAAGDLPDRLDAVDGRCRPRRPVSAVERIDTVGAWIVHRFAARHDAAVEGLDEDGQQLFDQVVARSSRWRCRPQAARRASRGGWARSARRSAITGRTLYGLLGFLGATTIAFVAVIRHPAPLPLQRDRAAVRGGRRVAALGIVGLMSFLIGMVIAQQGAVQLRSSARRCSRSTWSGG